jgi:Na+/proline symporter
VFSPWTLLSVILSYLLLLFPAVYFAERKERQGRSLVSNPYIYYSLSLAVYCTSWTFYGSEGKAANAGLSFLTIYVGPTLMAALWWIVLRKIIYPSKENRITTISDFISSRYGKLLFFSALVTLTPFAKESLSTINQHVHRIARIVRNLGDFARLYPRQMVPTSTREILENTSVWCL